MIYEQLADFVQNRMRMSHIYQPVMLLMLLRADGKCSVNKIAKAILAPITRSLSSPNLPPVPLVAATCSPDYRG